MTICHDCATNKGLVPKDKIAGVWTDICPYCKLTGSVCDEIHDYKRPGQKPVTMHDLLLYEAMADMPLEDQ